MNRKVKVVNGADVQIGTAVVDEKGNVISQKLDRELREDGLMCQSYSTKRDVVVIEPHP